MGKQYIATAFVYIVASFAAEAQKYWVQNDIDTGPLNQPVDHSDDPIVGNRCWAV